MTAYRLTTDARRDLRSIRDYIAGENPAAPNRMLDRIREKLVLYAGNPLLGDACPEFGSELRRFPVGNYVVYYRPVSGGLTVLRVLHGARDAPRFFTEPPDDTA